MCWTCLPAQETCSAAERVPSSLGIQCTDHFTFTYHPRDHASIQLLITQAEELREAIRWHLPPLPARLIAVRIATSQEEFLRLQPEPGVPGWTAAIAYPRVGLILMKAPRMLPDSHRELLRTFRHELTHILLADAFGGRPVPAWLHEGMAQLMEASWDIHRISVMTRAVLGDEIIPLWELDDSFPVDLHTAEIAYAQSYYFLSFLLNEFGRQSLQHFILELGQGAEVDIAISRATGMRLRDVVDRWEHYLRLRFNWIPILTGGGALWFMVSAMLIIGYVLKRRRATRLLRQWEEEEAAVWMKYPGEMVRERTDPEGEGKIDNG